MADWSTDWDSVTNEVYLQTLRAVRAPWQPIELVGGALTGGKVLEIFSKKNDES